MTDTITLAKQCEATELQPYDYGARASSLIISFENLEAFRQACVKEAVPAGHKVVPVEPSRDQLVAAQAAECDHSEHEEWLDFDSGECRRRYQAMLAAAPEVK